MVEAPEAPPTMLSAPEHRYFYAAVVAVVLAAVFKLGVLGPLSSSGSIPARTLMSAVVSEVRADDLTVESHLVPVPDSVLPSRDWSSPPRWLLRGYNRERASALLEGVAGAGAALECDQAGCSVQPSLDAVEALAPSVRSSLYSILATIDGNPQAADTMYRGSALGPFSASELIPPAIGPLVGALTWQRDGVMAFTDIPVVCRRLGSPEKCLAFIRAMLTRPSASVAVRLQVSGAIERATAGFAEGDQAAARERMEAARAAGAATLPLEALLPGWARWRLGTFPTVGEEWTNGFWTSLRFVGRAPRPIADGVALDAVLRQGFRREPTAAAARFGDVVVLRDAEGRALHSANWLLAGYLFEKSGVGRLQAWRIVPLREAMTEFPATASVDFWRTRGP